MTGDPPSSAGSGPAVLLLHGLGWDHSLWNPTVERFSPQYRMIAIDLDGTLLSPTGQVTPRTKAAVHRALGPHPFGPAPRIEAGARFGATLAAEAEGQFARIWGQASDRFG